MRNRQVLLNDLIRVFPCRIIWLSDWVTGGESRWLKLSVDDTLYDIDEALGHGGWVLFFFKAEQELPDQEVEQVPTDVPALKKLAQRFHAGAAIASLVDDDEWLTAVAE